MSQNYYFYSGINHPLSNWCASEYFLGEQKFNNVEQGFMFSKAQLFGDKETSDKILESTNPRKCHRLGRKIKYFDENKWSENKNGLMYNHLKNKFLQNKEFKEALIATGDKIIVNASSNNIWGIGLTEEEAKKTDISQWGENLLGRILTSLKQQIIYSEKPFLTRGANRLAYRHNTTEKGLERFDPRKNTWEIYIGTKFLHLFKRLKLPNNSVVVEVGPGSVSKVGEGLRQYGLQKNPLKGFCGTVYLVEPEKQALFYVQDYYSYWMPNAKIIGINATLDVFLKKVNFPIDLAISNHVLDDMIIGKFIGEHMSHFFRNHYDDSDIKQTARYWEELAKNTPLKMKIIDEVVKEWENLAIISKKMIISAYDSFVFRQNLNLYPSIGHANVLSQVCLHKIKKCLLSLGFKLLELNEVDVVQSPDFWLCMGEQISPITPILG